MDEAIGMMMMRLEMEGLADEVNVILTGDHGMTAVGNQRSLNLGAYADFDNDVEWSHLSAIGLIIPKQGQLEKVFMSLRLVNTAEEQW